MVVSVAFKVFVLSLPVCACSCVVLCSRRAVRMASGPGPSRRRCVNNPDCFCYVCGCYVIQRLKSNITSFVKKHIMLILKLNLGIRTKGEFHMSCVTRAFKVWDTGIKVHAHPCRLVYRRSGVNHKITTMTVTFACAMCRGTTKKIRRELNTHNCHQL
jgi:hypothetical protein